MAIQHERARARAHTHTLAHANRSTRMLFVRFSFISSSNNLQLVIRSRSLPLGWGGGNSCCRLHDASIPIFIHSNNSIPEGWTMTHWSRPSADDQNGNDRYVTSNATESSAHTPTRQLRLPAERVAGELRWMRDYCLTYLYTIFKTRPLTICLYGEWIAPWIFGACWLIPFRWAGAHRPEWATNKPGNCVRSATKNAKKVI